MIAKVIAGRAILLLVIMTVKILQGGPEMGGKGPVKNGYIDCDWGQLHYRSVNLESDLPLLIMLHQSPLSSRNYQALLPELSGQLRVLALDTPGFGQSAPPSKFWSAADFANIALVAADRLGVEQFYLFGRATGGVLP